MLRVGRVLFQSRIAVRGYTQVAGGANIEKREKTLEDKNVRDHEKQLVEDMIKQLEVLSPFHVPSPPLLTSFSSLRALHAKIYLSV